MVLFHFPPLGGVSMPRNVRNVQYLPRYGWTPVVLSPEGASGPLDPDALALVPPETTIYRARCLEPRDLRPVVSVARRIADIPRGLRGVRARPRPERPRGTPERQEESTHQSHTTGPAPSRLWRLYRLLAFPDGQVGWLPFAVVAAIRAYRAASFDVVYSTSAPVTAHLVAGIVKRLTGVPWVAEFRDPWRGNPVTEALAGPGPWLRRRLQTRLERWIVLSADRIVFVSPSTAQLYRKRYPDARGMVTITNGHDRSDIAVPAAAATPGRYRIVWTGTLDRPAELEIFLEAVEALLARRPALVEQLEFVFYGNVSDACRKVWDRFAANDRLARTVRFPGFVPRRDALQALADADAALIMLGSGAGMGQFVPGKLFDYLGQNKQVLAVLPPGDARDILDELGWGVVADPDAVAIAHAIERLLAQPSPARVADPDGIYDRVTLAGRLADTLHDAAESARGPRTVRGTP